MYSDPYYDDPSAAAAPAPAAPSTSGTHTFKGYWGGEKIYAAPDGTLVTENGSGGFVPAAAGLTEAALTSQPGWSDAGVRTMGGTPQQDAQGNVMWGAGGRMAGGPSFGADGGGTGAPAVDPSYLAPFDKQFDLSSLGTMTGASPGQANIPDFAGFAPDQPKFGGFSEFHQPTAADVLRDPSYQFRRDQAIQGVTNTKAAQGLYNSGGTIYDIANLAGNLASQDYGNEWNRDYNVWNQDNSNRLKDFGAQSDAWNQDNLNRVTGFSLKQGTSNEAYQRAVGQYNSMRDLFFANQNAPFSKLIQAAQIGAQTAPIAG